MSRATGSLLFVPVEKYEGEEQFFLDYASCVQLAARRLVLIDFSSVYEVHRYNDDVRVVYICTQSWLFSRKITELYSPFFIIFEEQ